MPCTVHCLVSKEEDLAPLRERIADAGIPDDRVHVVWRFDPAHASTHDLLSAWCSFMAPARWWWAQALRDTLPTVEVGEPPTPPGQPASGRGGPA